MTKFTKRFNSACKRVAFWHIMTARLNDFASLVNQREALTPEDVKTLRRIHEALYECYLLAKDRKNYHKGDMEAIRKELSHESRVTNQSRKSR